MSDPERETETPDGRLATSPTEVTANGRVSEPEPPAPIPLHPGDDEPPRRRVKVKKWRVALVVFGLGIIAAISTVFGMMMAVASGLPQLEEPASQNSRMVDMHGRPLGLLTGNQRRVVVEASDISPVMKQAIIAIEDRRFYTNDGVDVRGIARALWEDVRAKQTVQGGSTITQQFVKTALAAQQKRTLFNKLREAALAYQITHKWSKQRILRNYLNTIYFGNGAYGIESAARTYFQTPNHPACGTAGHRKCAAQLEPAEAAMLAGIVQSPSAYDPLLHPKAAKTRRDLVLQRMLEQGYISRPQYDQAVAEPVPLRADVTPPQEDKSDPDPYFTSWVRQQVVDKLGGGQVGARQAFEGGLTIKTTLDVKLQDAAERAIQQWLAWKDGPRASMVVLDNTNGEVRAMVGGDDYGAKPFNLATQGQRQPGSAFKPFVLAQALTDGISPNSTWDSHKLTFNLGKEHVVVQNYNDAYAGITTLAHATTFSDNSVYVQVARQIGSKRVARLAREMGIRTPVSRNLSIALGGLHQGVTPLDMAHAYLTFANGGRFVYGTMSPGELRGIRRPGPVGIESITRKDQPVSLPTGQEAVNHKRTKRILDPKVAATVTSLLQTVVKTGTGARAAVADTFVAGKTGTTENYGDAWFVGWTGRYTVAIWVGYPDKLRPMRTEFAGQPVAGGTFPAAIFHSFIQNAFAIYPKKKKEKDKDAEATGSATPTPGASAPTTPAPAPSTQAPSGGTGNGGENGKGNGGNGGGDGDTGGAQPAPQPPAEQPPTQPTPAPTAPPTGAAPPAPTG
jgi:penicillin-binding protein 1A